MTFFRRRNVQHSKLLGTSAFTSCFNFGGQQADEHEFDDHLISNIPIVKISTVPQKNAHLSESRPTFPDLECIKVQSIFQQSTHLQAEPSVSSSINSCENFQKYHSSHLPQSISVSTQISPSVSKASFRCRTTRKLSVEQQNLANFTNINLNGTTIQVKRSHKRTYSLNKDEPKSRNQTDLKKCCKSKYSHRSLTKGLCKQFFSKNQYGDLSPWKMEELEEFPL